MTLSEVVCASVGDWCATDLSRETRFGKANQVDFSGRSALVGNDIRLEVERRREDPVNNVVKAWRQAAENPREAFILVHIFSGFYRSRMAKFENARFVGEMMNMWADTSGRNITYLTVLLDFEPPMGGADAIIENAVAETIGQQIRSELDGRIQKRDCRQRS
jgi:hypothetical protein